MYIQQTKGSPFSTNSTQEYFYKEESCIKQNKNIQRECTREWDSDREAEKEGKGRKRKKGSEE